MLHEHAHVEMGQITATKRVRGFWLTTSFRVVSPLSCGSCGGAKNRRGALGKEEEVPLASTPHSLTGVNMEGEKKQNNNNRKNQYPYHAHISRN